MRHWFHTPLTHYDTDNNYIINYMCLNLHGATRGVTVSMSAFLACHQCDCAGSSLAWGWTLRAVVCGIF